AHLPHELDGPRVHTTGRTAPRGRGRDVPPAVHPSKRLGHLAPVRVLHAHEEDSFHGHRDTWVTGEASNNRGGSSNGSRGAEECRTDRLRGRRCAWSRGGTGHRTA